MPSLRGPWNARAKMLPKTQHVSIVLNTTTYQRMIDWTTDGTHLVIYDLAALLECIGTDVLKKEKAATFGAFTRQMRVHPGARLTGIAS